jgi:hypothetical protein
MRAIHVSAILVGALAVAVSASGQTVIRRTPVTHARKLGVNGYGIVEIENMLASNSFKAVTTDKKSSLTFAGAGVDVVDIYQGLFARVAFTHTSTNGTRAFVDSSGRAVSLGIPLTIDITPIEIGGGWRFAPSSADTIPYVGAALLMQQYKETSSLGSASDNVDATDKGGTFFGGVTLKFGHFVVGVEAQYRHVPNVLGASGVSAAYNETNLGGAVFRVTFGAGF